MTRETYAKHNGMTEGKHAPKTYCVWRVLGPAGPAETVFAYGIESAKKAILGCWDWEVTTETGEVVKDIYLR